MISSLSGSPDPSRPDTPSGISSARSTDPSLTTGTDQVNPLPNKLVKRSVSQRVLSLDKSRFPLLRRPATSHQRHAETDHKTPIQPHEPVLPSPITIWRPYFSAETYQPRKRHTSGALRQRTIRTVSDARGYRPALVPGHAIAPRQSFGDSDRNDTNNSSVLAPKPLPRRKIRASGTQGRRAFTTPASVSGHLLDDGHLRSRSSPLSPISHVSTFDVSLPSGTPAFSDPTTASSDRVFTDDDSMDFQSDTAYDSLATRATASSHSGLRGLRIESVFEEVPPTSNGNTLLGLEELIREGSLDKHFHGVKVDESLAYADDVGFASNLQQRQSQGDNSSTEPRSTTPPYRERSLDDDPMATPVPKKVYNSVHVMNSSPPSMATPRQTTLSSAAILEEQPSGPSIELLSDLDWTASGEPIFDDASMLPGIPSSPTWNSHIERNNVVIDETSTYERSSEKRASIFGWSENHKSNQDGLNGSSPRPKTVHGKQDMELRGSRPIGRRGPSALHLRSQSVPVTRDLAHDFETVRMSSKFGTWGLGTKGVSEEWSEDFDLDDATGPTTLDMVDENGSISNTGSIRGVKVPQAIIDRQASVRGQFDQVQEFMVLVEELKRLRVQGTTLQLVQTQSQSLWEDAESIVNLATLNDEDDDDFPIPQSPTSQMSVDGFDDDYHTPGQSRRHSGRHLRQSSELGRSGSGTTTPTAGRPRGESLAHARILLQDFHHKRNGPESSPAEIEIHKQKKLPFDTQDLHDLVVRARHIKGALKELLRKADPIAAVSPTKSPKLFQDPPFSNIFKKPEGSPPPSPRKRGMTKSHSANSYLGSLTAAESEHDLAGNMRMLTVA